METDRRVRRYRGSIARNKETTSHESGPARWRRVPGLLFGIAAAALAIVLAAVLLRPDSEPVGRGERERGPIHVHAIGVNPGDDALFIATHTGLFRLAPAASKAQRVGDRYQDTMGFTVIGRDRFLGSGHPDLRDRQPSLLGLIKSKDGGESWRPISLYGKADFHILRARGPRLVGYDARHGRVMTSRDGGKAWSAYRFDGPLVDMVLAPGGRQLLATTPSQLILSRDGGRSWGGLSETTGLLAWPRQDRLYLLAPDGRLWLSPDRGKRWRGLGTIEDKPAAFVVNKGRMYAALHDGTIKASNDNGLSWRRLAKPS